MKVEWPPMKHNDYTGLAAEVYRLYLDVFWDKFGLPRGLADLVGHHGEALCESEYRALGEKHYTDSLLICVRNAAYSAARAADRWDNLKPMRLEPPILDYGCGVGFTCLYLEKSGLAPCYGHDLEGLQTQVAESVGVKAWGGEPVNTVLCLNMLEHVPQPVDILKNLRKLTPRVIANICTSPKHTHIASEDDLLQCKRMLVDTGCLYGH